MERSEGACVKQRREYEYGTEKDRVGPRTRETNHCIANYTEEADGRPGGDRVEKYEDGLHAFSRALLQLPADTVTGAAGLGPRQLSRRCILTGSHLFETLQLAWAECVKKRTY